MNDDLAGLEILFLWRLATSGGGDWKKEVKPDINGPSRKRLLGAGLIEEEKRSPDGGGRKLLYFALTERGWQWLSEHLDASISTRSPASMDILVRLLARLQVHLNASGISLAEFIQPGPTNLQASQDDLDREIESAYYSLSGGGPSVRIRLADLRDALPGFPREDVDAALLDMALAGTTSLFRLDNPLEISPRDREATLTTPSGEERHVIYLGGRGS